MLQVIRNPHYQIAVQNKQMLIIIFIRIIHTSFAFLTGKPFRSTTSVKSCHFRNWDFQFYSRNGFDQVQLPIIPKAPHQRSCFRSARPFFLSFNLSNNARHVNFIYVDQTYQRVDGATALPQKINQAFIYATFFAIVRGCGVIPNRECFLKATHIIR